MRTNHRRPAFTLVELLVVMGIMLTLMSLALYLNNRTADNRRVVRAADQLQGWLGSIKQRAIRDKSPRGLALLGGPTAVDNLQFTETPEPWPGSVGGALQVMSWDLWYDTDGSAANGVQPPPNPRSFAFLQNSVIGLVSDGDTLEILEPRSTHRILPGFPASYTADSPPITPARVAPFYFPPLPTPVSTTLPPYTVGVGVGIGPQRDKCPNRLNVLQLSSPIPGITLPQAGTTSTQPATWFPLQFIPPTNYRISRKPTALIGESPVRLPKEVAISVADCRGLVPTTNADGTVTLNITFSPNGKLSDSTQNVILWVADLNGVADPVLIVIYARTGLIGVHPVDKTGVDPYSFTKDGQSSGL